VALRETVHVDVVDLGAQRVRQLLGVRRLSRSGGK
jgi:hypothetical protein